MKFAAIITIYFLVLAAIYWANAQYDLIYDTLICCIGPGIIIGLVFIFVKALSVMVRS